MNKTLALMAWRNLWRNRRRTIITLFGISFGVFLAVIFTGIGDYTYGNMIDHSAKLGAGHVVVQHREYQDLPTLENSVPAAGRYSSKAKEDPRVVTSLSRISGAALLATATDSQGAFFMAVDPETESEETLAILDALSEGQMLETADDQGVVLGAKLAKALHVTLGKKLVYTMTDRNGDVVSGLARVKAIVETGAPTVDGGLCILAIDTVRELLGYGPDEATQVAVFVQDHRDSQDVANALSGELDESTVALTWAEASPDLAGFITMKEAGAKFMEGLIMVLLAAGIFNTLFVSVMERLREFGIMSALGFSAGSLFALVMWESLWLALVGLVAAALVTAFPYYHFHTVGIDYGELVGEGAEVAGIAVESIMRVDIHGQNLVIIGAAVLLATLLSGLYPAWRAGRTNPADVIRLQ